MDKWGCVHVALFYNITIKMKEGLFQIIDYSGKVISEPKLTSVGSRNSCFKEGMAPVKIGDKWGYIAPNGRQTIEPRFSIDAGKFNNSLARVTDDNTFRGWKTGFIDKTGKYVIEPLFNSACDFIDNLALVQYGEKYGFINKSGAFIIEPKFNDAYVFSEGLASVKKGDKWGYIDKTGRFIIEPKFDSGSFFQDSLCPVNFKGEWGYIDKTGEIVISPKFSNATCFHEGFACVKSNGKWGFIDQKGKFVIEPQFNHSGLFTDGLFQVNVEDKIGFIDFTGNNVIEPKYEQVCPFEDGLARAKTQNKWGYINKKGVYVIEPQYDYCCDFSEGLAIVVTDKKLLTSSVNLNKTSPKQQPTIISGSQQSHSRVSSKRTKGGCYIATAIYGSYDCPEVWMLRRYRDKVLDNTWYGRAFIRAYYAISPTLVKWFGKTDWFRNLFSKPLSRWIAKLNKQGFEDTPYNDKY